MSFDDDRDDDPSPSGLPLPPEDRLWRHPSELASPGGAPAPESPQPHRNRGRWGLVAVSCLAGAAFTFGLVAAGGFLRTRVIERETNRASPQTDGESVKGAVARATPSVARLDAETGLGPRVGSAVVLGPAGHLVTSTGLVDGSSKLTVTFSDGTTFPAQVTGNDPVTGLSVLSVPSTSLAPPSVAANSPSAGDLAVTVAGPTEPHGDSLVGAGVVSASGRTVGGTNGTYQPMVQTDRSPAPEAEGGAVVDGTGALVGISIHPAGLVGDESGWAVPADVATRVTNDIVTVGRAQHPWLGIKVQDDPASGNPPSTTAAPTAAPSTSPGSTAPLTTAAGATAPPSSVEVKESEAPAPTPPASSEPITPASTQLAPPDRQGVTVRSVEPSSPAAQVGLRPGDQVIEVDGEPVISMGGLLSAMRQAEPGQKLSLSYRRDGRTSKVEVTLAARPDG